MSKTKGIALVLTNLKVASPKTLINLSSLKKLCILLSIVGSLFVVGAIVIILPRWQINDAGIVDEEKRLIQENASRTIIIQGLGGIFFVITAYFTWRNLKVAEVNLKVIEDKQITERFAKAVEMLGHADIHVRLGGIYALERISKDSDQDYWQIMEILTAYVREKSHQNKQGTTRASIDIQAILTIITRRRKNYQQGEENCLDLSESNLTGAILWDSNLNGAYLSGSILRNADLSNAKLSGAILSDTDLKDAIFRNANLTKAGLRGAILSGVDFMGADLSQVELTGNKLSKMDLNYAQLNGAYLNDTDLSHAKLSHAKLNRAKLSHANLSGVDLSYADLERAYLSDANLSGADLSNTNLSCANLSGADLSNTDLTSTNLRDAKGLTPQQVRDAAHWEKAKYDPEFFKQLISL
ncbi:pentapeptide repeat-containing protein [Mastigocoleus sp. MO_188.B34]|uniref:pentapeptide repeat-containing protein n=1 Tax=Mastigocoleus sp. MO_188.B34 TaxID=3036635 RepID=UPI002625D3C3|nr:pentapeptide repeat-containing protein [Mastigocoleus sp. MO_188.B34]MDJ0695674.1 pentapeptide repeat-containing protein [Mastigocoleus sp. MO_188.B34]